jgi:purine-binding chemotaxis protein CheW
MHTQSNSGARAAANAPEQAHDGGQYLTFMLGGEMFAISILKIKEIIEFRGLTTVPMMPASIRGVINLRGAVVPVLDLAARFGGESRPPARRACIVIVEVEHDGARQDIGVIVDAVNAVMDIAASAIEPAPAFGARIRTNFIQGMGNVAGKFVIILDADHVLAVDDIAGLAGAHSPEAQSDGTGAAGDLAAA